MVRVAGKIAFVTGAASGLGEACARMLAQEGATVVIADLDFREAERVAVEIRHAGAAAWALHLDVTDEAQWVGAIDQVRSRHGGLNVGINCAGINVGRTFPSETTFADWRKVTSVNLDGVFLGTKHMLGLMMETGPVNGSIINISSVMGMVGLEGIAAYNASKGGVRLYTKSVALSCAERRLNIRVNSIHPGFIDTPLLQRALDRFKDRAEAIRTYDELQPVGRLGRPEDIAYGALYLASDEASFVTGTELIIDGGYTAR